MIQDTRGGAATTAPQLRIAFVTGAARGLGLASARRLAAGGFRLVVTDRDGAAAQAAAASLPGTGHVGLGLDVTDEPAMRCLRAGRI